MFGCNQKPGAPPSRTSASPGLAALTEWLWTWSGQVIQTQFSSMKQAPSGPSHTVLVPRMSEKAKDTRETSALMTMHEMLYGISRVLLLLSSSHDWR